jgi:hypothetical protein
MGRPRDEYRCGQEEQHHTNAAGGVMKPQAPPNRRVRPATSSEREYLEISIKQYEERATFLFQAIMEDHGSFEARRIFARCAKPPTKRERQLHANALLVWRLMHMPKNNIRQLAVLLAKENGTDPRSLEKQIERALKNNRVAEYIFKTLSEVGTKTLPWTF